MHTHNSPRLVKSILPRVFLPIAIKPGPASVLRRVVDMLPSPNVQRTSGGGCPAADVQQLRDISDILHARSAQILRREEAV